MNRTRPKQIVIRVSEEELAQIKEKVEQSGKSQQQYIIEALTQSNIVNLDGLKEIYPELKRQGNNLNQIAKKLNENGYVDYKQELPNTMKEVRDAIQLPDDAVLTPLPMDEDISSLSAILLDDDYYEFLKQGKVTVDGVTVLDAAYLIPFKAKAWMNLTDRKAAGEHVDIDI